LNLRFWVEIIFLCLFAGKTSQKQANGENTAPKIQHKEMKIIIPGQNKKEVSVYLPFPG
jgi:hypothetical protein